MTAHQARRRLRAAIAADDVIVAPGVFDGISASLVRSSGSPPRT